MTIYAIIGLLAACGVATRICRGSRIVPGTTTAPIPATWSLIAFSQVRPRRWPK